MGRLETGIVEKIDATDWQDAEGITEQAKLGTNSMLATRDYSVKCHTGVQPIGVLKGFWLWWCFAHDQPQMKCALGRSEAELIRIKSEAIEVIKNGAKKA